MKYEITQIFACLPSIINFFEVLVKTVMVELFYDMFSLVYNGFWYGISFIYLLSCFKIIVCNIFTQRLK